jgi:hypothetical protein
LEIQPSHHSSSKTIQACVMQLPSPNKMPQDRIFFPQNEQAFFVTTVRSFVAYVLATVTNKECLA